MIEAAIKYHKTSALILGLLLCAALPPYFYFWMAPLVFSLYYVLLLKQNGLKTAAACGYWFGFGFFAGGFYWIGNALLIDWQHTGWLYPITLFLNGAFFGMFTVLPAMAVKCKFLRSDISKMLFFGAMWGISAEWVRSWFCTGFPWNPLSSILLFDDKLPQGLAIFGTYGLSAILACVFCFPAMFLLKQNKKNLLLSFGGLVLPLFALYAYGKNVLPTNFESAENVSVRLVQPSIEQTAEHSFERAENELKQHIELTKEQSLSGINFVVWGETASPFDLTYERGYMRQVAEVVPENGYLVSGMLRREFLPSGDDYKLYNSLALINSAGQVVELYSKNHLVPFGEYIPFRSVLPDFVHPLTNMVAEFGRGVKYQTIIPDGFAEFAPLICYEIIFSDNVVRKENKPKWMILLTYDGWYGISSGPYQHLAAAQMRAIEEGINIVRSANSGISAVISAYGQVMTQIPLNERGIADAKVPLSMAHGTLFGKFGHWILLLTSGGMMLLGFIFSVITRGK